MRAGKDETGNGRILLAQFSDQINQSTQGMSLRIDDPVPQEVAKTPHRTIRIQGIFHPFPQRP
jgi:hypothetical protein